MRWLAVLVALLVAACDRPMPQLICHNANCVAPVAPERDNSLGALRESLALSQGGRPMLDGVEIDIFWRASDSMCLFAHDLDGVRTELASEAADLIVEHLAQPGPATHGGGPLRVFIELKSHVGVSKSERHTPEQRALHAQCAWTVYKTISDAATANSEQVEFVYAAFNPPLLQAMIDNAPASTPSSYQLEAFYGVPRPLDTETRPLSDYAGIPITVIEMHVQWIHDAQWEAVSDGDFEIGFFMFSATVETFQAIEQYEPSFVNTNEAHLMRRWLDR